MSLVNSYLHVTSLQVKVMFGFLALQANVRLLIGLFHRCFALSHAAFRREPKFMVAVMHQLWRLRPRSIS
jgi:hypothetical protein